MKKSIVFIVCLMGLLSVQTLLAQNKWSFELKGDAAFATKDLGDVALKTGMGFEAMLDYQIVAPIGVYVGWGWHQFSSDQYLADLDFEETGYMFGLQFKKAIGSSDLAYFVRGGGIYNHIEVESTDGDITSDSGHGLGWQAVVGLDITFLNSWHLRPAIKYQALNRDLEMVGEGGVMTTSSVDLNYVSLGVGIAKSF